jgi:hypothetical protein
MIGGGSSMDVSCPGSPVMTPSHHSTCSITVLILVLHAGSVLGEWDMSSNKINCVIKCYIGKIWGSHSNNYEDGCLLGCCTL